MEFRIDELLNGFEDQSVQIRIIEYTSADRIKELTMKKIKQDHPEGRRRRSGRNPFTVVLAAVLVFALTASVFAAFSIHRKQQQQLRESLKIDENNVTSYVEYPEPEASLPADAAEGLPVGENEKREHTVTLLSAIRDDSFQRVYVNVSPVTREEALEATANACFGYSLGDTNKGGFANIPFDRSLITEEDVILVHDEKLGIAYETLDPEKLQSLQMAYSYDEGSQTLMLTCSIAESDLPENEPTVLHILKLNSNYGAEKDLGTVSLMPTALEMREILFDRPIELYNDVLKESCRVAGVQMYPTGVAWMVELNNAAKLYGDGALSQEEQSALMSWLDCIDVPLGEAVLTFEDGSEFITGTILTSLYENGRVMHRASWQTTIDIHAVSSIRIAGETREMK